jgi:N-acetylglucosamine-6-sulfatase
MRKIGVVLTSVALAVGMLLFGSCGGATDSMRKAKDQTAPRPNILFVMTDDQPKDTMIAMPEVRTRVRDMGMSLKNAYVSESLCCPSRASILRGQYPHNTGVERDGPPNGGVQTFRENGKESSTIVTLLSDSGYATGLVGKYMNGYDASYTPPGWGYWYAKADASTPGDPARENGTVIDYAGVPGNWGDRLDEKAMGFLDRSTDQASDGPFALFFWSGQPHLQAGDYADRYANMYTRVALPSKPSFDEADVSDKPQWVQDLPRISAGDRDQLTQWRRNQLRSVRQVDDTVGKMLDLLDQRGELNNTYVVFTTDNGTHMGEHRYRDWHGAKSTAYEEAANVPMYVRGPRVGVGSTSGRLVLNNDLAPTFARIAGLAPPSYVDGRSLLPVWGGNGAAWRTAVLNERPVKDGYPVSIYSSALTRRYTYVDYGSTGEKELYDRNSDPYELDNAYDPAAPPSDLSSRLRALEGCAGDACRVAEDGP